MFFGGGRGNCDYVFFLEVLVVMIYVLRLKKKMKLKGKKQQKTGKESKPGERNDSESEGNF